jgi:hypothetical protein
MLNTTDRERQSIVDSLASQAPDERVDLVQKVYVEQLHGITHAIWDVHTDKERWWVITEPTNLYSQTQFPNMDLALTFHVGLCLRIPRGGRRDLADLGVEPFLACWGAFQEAQDAIGMAQEIEDYQALGVRCRECLLSLVHSVQDAVAISAPDVKRSDFVGWCDAIADAVLTGPSQKPRRQLLKSSAKATWDFVNWLTHSRSSHFHDAEAALASTEQTLSLYTTALIRYIRGVPDRCPACGSQRLSPERGSHSNDPTKLYERPVCTACGWSGRPVEIPVAVAERVEPKGECAIMATPLRGTPPPPPTVDDE